MWRLCKLGYRHEPRSCVAAFVLVAARGAARRAARAVAEAARRRRPRGELGAGPRRRRSALGVSATATWFLRTVSTRVQRRFRDKVTIALESHVATLQASIATIAHQERPEYLDRLSVLRDQVFMLDHMYMSLFSTCGWILRLGVTVALLVSIHPALVLLALRAARSSPRLAPGRRARRLGGGAPQAGWRVTSSPATTAPPGKEVRVIGIGDRLVGSAVRVGAGIGRRLARGRRRPGTRRAGRLRRRLRRRHRVRFLGLRAGR